MFCVGELNPSGGVRDGAVYKSHDTKALGESKVAGLLNPGIRQR